MKQNLKIPMKGVKIDLSNATPTELTPKLLQEQLARIGLTCAATDQKRLAIYTEEVKAQLLDGKMQVYSIKMRRNGVNVSSVHDDYALANLHSGPANSQRDLGACIAGGFIDAAVGNWEPRETTGGYDRLLQTVINAKHFAELKARVVPIFGGVQGQPIVNNERLASADAVKAMFSKTATAAATVVMADGGLNKDAMEATMSNAIAPPNQLPENQDYTNVDDRVLLLVKNYRPEAREADAIGVMNISWDLFISKYTEKKEKDHKTETTVVSRVVLYDDVQNLQDDYNYIVGLQL